MTRISERQLPRTGLALSTLGLGTAPLGGLLQAMSEAQARETIAAAWQAGIRFVDTAPFYGYSRAEHRVGEALREHPRDEWVLSTKVGRLLRPTAPVAPVGERPRGDAWVDPLPFRPEFDYTAAAIRRSIEDSLQRLGTHRIDIALVHDIGRVTHGDRHAHYWAQLTEGGGLRELESLRSEGLISAIGLGVNEWEVVHEAMQHADLDCCLLAGRYTLLEQHSLHPFLDDCVARQVGVIVGGPFNSGILASPAAGAPLATFDYAAAPAEVVQRVERLRAVCGEFGVSLAAAALQFPMAHPAVVSCLPGPRSAAELQGILRWRAEPIPAGLWSALLERGLLHADAPVPREAAA